MMKSMHLSAALSVAIALCPLAAGAQTQVEHTDVPRNAYFGDIHVHTGWSADAGLDGALDAVRQGESRSQRYGGRCTAHASGARVQLADLVPS
jgi:hypothetical protein